MNDTSPRSGQPLIWMLALAAATAVAYLALLGWDRQKDLDPVTGNETGPYSAWQVIGLALVVAVLAFVAGRQHHMVAAVVAISATLTVAFIVSAVTGPEPGLWPVGAALMALGSAAGTALAAFIGHLTARPPTA